MFRSAADGVWPDAPFIVLRHIILGSIIDRAHRTSDRSLIRVVWPATGIEGSGGTTPRPIRVDVLLWLRLCRSTQTRTPWGLLKRIH